MKVIFDKDLKKVRKKAMRLSEEHSRQCKQQV